MYMEKHLFNYQLIKKLRTQKKISLDNVIKQIQERYQISHPSITKQHLNKIERGESIPSITVASLLAKFYKLKLSDLIEIVKEG